jgi:hypothetical protein
VYKLIINTYSLKFIIVNLTSMKYLVCNMCDKNSNIGPLNPLNDFANYPVANIKTLTKLAVLYNFVDKLEELCLTNRNQ